MLERAVVVKGEFPKAKQVIRSPADRKGNDYREDCPEMLTGHGDSLLLHLEDETQIAEAHCQQREKVAKKELHPGQNMVSHQGEVMVMFLEIVITNNVVIDFHSVPEVQARTSKQRSQKPDR